MSRSRKILAVLAIVVVIAAMIGSGIYFFTRGVADAATDFFATVSASGPQAAYRKASPAFRQAMGESAFTALAERAGLARFQHASWTQRKIENNTGSVSGTLRLDEDVSLPATVQLARNDAGQWQVFNFELKLPGGTSSNLPPSQQQQAPAQTGLHAQLSVRPPPPSSDAPEPGPDSNAQTHDAISASIGGKPWSAGGTALLALKLGNAVVVNTAPMIRADHSIDATALQLQFDANANGAQTLGRDCGRSQPCLELTVDNNHYKVDPSAHTPATMTITRNDGHRIEGTFSADMVALEGKLAIQRGHFAVTLN